MIDLRQDAEAEYILNQLYKHRQLQISLPVMNIAVLGNSLLTLNLKDFIKKFVDHRVNVIKNRSNFDLRHCDGPAPHGGGAPDSLEEHRR